jgi:hypothetical protein
MDFNLFLLFLPAVLIGYYILDLRGNGFIVFTGVMFFVFFFVTGTIPFPLNITSNTTISSLFWNATEVNHAQPPPVDNPVQETPVIVPEKTEKPLNETWNNDWIHRT